MALLSNRNLPSDVCRAGTYRNKKEKKSDEIKLNLMKYFIIKHESIRDILLEYPSIEHIQIDFDYCQKKAEFLGYVSKFFFLNKANGWYSLCRSGISWGMPPFCWSPRIQNLMPLLPWCQNIEPQSSLCMLESYLDKCKGWPIAVWFVEKVKNKNKKK